MSQAAFLQYIVTQLDVVGICFMVTGSVASSYHGEPRATYDIDLVIQADEAQVDRLASLVAERCYVSAHAAREAVQRRTMFNVVDLQTGIKADLIPRKERPFSLEEFQRRQRAVIAGVEAFVASVEDCILSKLEWSVQGESERQYQDSLKMARIAGVGLDIQYLQIWADSLGVKAILAKLLADAGLE